MDFKYFLRYFFIAIVSCAMAFFDLLYLSIVIKGGAYVMLCYLCYKKSTNPAPYNLFFYLGIFSAFIAESYNTVDVKYYLYEINAFYISYNVFTILLLRINVSSINCNIRKGLLLPIILSSLFILYAFFEALNLITPGLKDVIVIGYIYGFSFLILIFYLGLTYVTNHKKRYLWLLVYLITVVFIVIMGSVEALYYNNEIIKLFVWLEQIITHFFLFKFLITPTSEGVMYLDENNKLC